MFKSRPLQFTWSVLGPSSIQPTDSFLFSNRRSLLSPAGRGRPIKLSCLNWPLTFLRKPTPSVTPHQAFVFNHPRHDGPDWTWNLKDDREQEEEGAVRHKREEDRNKKDVKTAQNCSYIKPKPVIESTFHSSINNQKPSASCEQRCRRRAQRRLLTDDHDCLLLTNSGTLSDVFICMEINIKNTDSK